ncbi:MAG: ArnT family glycosyltransferase, partial [Chthoniobacterales bacterium]
VLAVALAFLALGSAALGANGSFAAALIWLTNIGIIEKGRLIEIEALYASLTGLALICWLSWWQQRRSAWLTSTVPWLFLGLGMLAKGPLHLVFFYAVVVAVLFRNRELRILLHPAHFIGVIVMLGIFAAWAIPSLQLMRQNDVAHTWSRQFSGRLSGEDFHLSGWLMNIPRSVGYFLPWTFLLLFLPRAVFADDRAAKMASGLAWGTALSFIGVSLLPGALARYTMPLLGAASWLAAMLLTAERFDLPRWLRPRRPSGVLPALRLPVIVAAIAAVAIALYAVAAIPYLKKREKVRNLAQQINAAVSANEPLYAVDPDYQPFLFYVRDPIIYVPRVADLPTTAREVLVQARDESEALQSVKWQPLTPRAVLRLKDYRGKSVTLLHVGADS